MPLDDAYQGGTDAALLDQVQRPRGPQRQAPRFSMWGMLTDAASAIPRGGFEELGSLADTLKGFGSVLATTEASAGGMFSLQSAEERRQSQAATERLRKSGPDMMSEPGRSFRNVAESWAPDPATTHSAQLAIHEVVRAAGKAVRNIAIAGPVIGGTAFALEEGLTTADKLARQGVDKDTRTAVGAVTALTTGVSAALPVAGQTWAQTLGLALAGGPVSYVVQQAATRHILEAQDYAKLADAYDPFDPVGLTLSTVIPLGFGAFAMRAGSKAAKGAEPQPAAAHADPEAVDAARTALLAENQANTRPVPASDLAGSAQHEQAYGRAIEQMMAGGRVDVTDVAPLHGAEAIRAQMEGRLDPLRRALDERQQAVSLEEPPVVPRETAQASAPGEAAKPAAEAGGIPIESPELHARATQIEQSQPQLMVQLEGMDRPMPVGELMARMREEIAQDMAEAPLLQTAAECFLSTL